MSIITTGDDSRVSAAEPSGSQSRSKYMYYRMFQNDGPISSYHALGSGGTQGTGRIGRLRLDDLPPPRTIKILKRSIARREGFDPDATQQIYPYSSAQVLEDPSPLDDLMTEVGNDRHSPLEILIQDDASRSPQTTLPSISPPKPLTSDFSFWITNEAGEIQPNFDRKHPYRLAMADPPPPWKRAHVKGKDKFALLWDVPDSPKLITTAVHEHALLYVDTRAKPVRNGGTGEILPHYRVIIVAERLLGGERPIAIAFLACAIN
ncbi:hypothetical protein DL93DRAFT_2170220 [Clavulina sp. PMI_390]|nr:hypothetical protein DL93DRAFT_2170220 [Clavulina sp. PMI_390]